MQHISIQVVAEHRDFVDRVRQAIPEAVIADADRITGKQLMVTVILPVSLAAAQIVAPYVVTQQPVGRKKVVIGGDVISAENLTKEELEIALQAYVDARQQQTASEAATRKKKATSKQP
jgi:hypothetical protein